MLESKIKYGNESVKVLENLKELANASNNDWMIVAFYGVLAIVYALLDIAQSNRENP